MTLICTIELVPGGREDSPRRQVLGVIEISNVGGTQQTGHYRFALLKRLGKYTRGSVWRHALACREDSDAVDDVLVGNLEGFPRQRLGPYDLLYRALRACGMEERNG